MQLRNWAGNVTFTAERLHRPTSVEQLQQLVADARAIRALGTGHSFNRIADTEGELVSVLDLAGPVLVDDRSATVQLPAGLRYGELADLLDARGWALDNLGSLPHISVAGACATGTHGSGNANRCLAAAAVGVEFVRSDGELVRLGRDDDDFPAAVLGLGALGVVTSLTLQLRPRFELSQDVWLDLPVERAAEHIEAITASGYSVSLFTTWRRPELIDQVWIKREAGAPPAEQLRGWGARPATEPQHPILGADPVAATTQLGAPGPWHERLPHFRREFTPSHGDEVQSEFLVPREHAAAAIGALRAAADRFAAPLLVCEMRTVAADELWLSPCHGRATFALHFTWAPDVPRAAIVAVQDALGPLDPRPHWGKVFAYPREQVQAHYPRLPAFRAAAQRFDPQRTFGNAFLDEYVY